MSVKRRRDFDPTGFVEIPDFPGYFCSRDGVFVSVRRNRLTELKKCEGKVGYQLVTLYQGTRKGHIRYVHRILAALFIRPPRPGEVVNHINGIKTDNRIENLEWCTEKENIHHKDRVLQKHNQGERHGMSKLTRTQVWEIRKRLVDGEGPAAIARRFGVHQSTISYIKSGKLWRSVTRAV